MDVCMLPSSPWFDPVRNRNDANGATAFSNQVGHSNPNLELQKIIRNSQPVTRASSKTNQASEACESKLDDVAERIDGLKQALRRRAAVEHEHGDLALQIKQQRAEVRQRERELAMELARVDNDLASFKAKLASLKSQQSAESLAVLQRASTPLAVEMQWATKHSDSAGAHRIMSPATVSPLAELLHPKPSEVIGNLEPGTLVKVVGVLRVPDIRKVRARIQKPLQGWISLLDLEVPKRWAKSIEVEAELKHAWAKATVEDCVASRSVLLRGWAAKVDADQMAFFESLRDIRADITKCHAGNFVQPVKVTRAVREFNATGFSRVAVERALEAQTEQMKIDRERAGMQLGEAESQAFMLVDKVESAAARNRILSSAVARLESFLNELGSFGARETFGLLSFWRQKDEEFHFLPGSRDNLPTNASKDGVSAVEALPLLAEDLGECEQEASSGQTRIDAMLRSAEELQRQRGERMQEVADLRRRFAPLRAAMHTTPARRQLAAGQCRLHRVRQIISQVATDAIVEMKEVEAWVQSLQFLLAQLLDAAAPPKVRCSWLSESMKRCGNFRPGHFTEVSPESMNDQPGDFVEVAQRLRQLLEQAKLELRRQNEVLAAPGLKEAKSPLEILHDLEWVAEQLDEQRMHMNQRHQDELRALQDSGSQESQQKDSDLIQLQLRHDNESLQMTRLLKEQEAKLTHKKKLHDKFEAGADTSNEIEGAEELEFLPDAKPSGQRDDLQEQYMPRIPVDELATRLAEALHQFRPCSGKCEGEKRYGSGARSLWWLAANVAALTWYGEAELQDLGAPPPIDSRREFYSLADSRFARERRYEDEWREALPPQPSPLVSPFSVGSE